MDSPKGWGSQLLGLQEDIAEEPLYHSSVREFTSRCKAAIRHKHCTHKRPALLLYASFSFRCICTLYEGVSKYADSNSPSVICTMQLYRTKSCVSTPIVVCIQLAQSRKCASRLFLNKLSQSIIEKIRKCGHTQAGSSQQVRNKKILRNRRRVCVPPLPSTEEDRVITHT